MSKKQTKHSPLGASFAESWMTCTMRPHATKDLPPEKPSVYAAEGTLAHLVAENILAREIFGARRPPGKFDIGTKHEIEGYELEVNDEMQEAVYIYTDFILQAIKKFKIYKSNIFLEHRVEIGGLGNELFGTSDAILHLPFNRLIVVDYKHGQGRRVEVKDNKQLKYYALGALAAISPDWRSELSYVEMVIVQPRNGGISNEVITIEELEDFYNELMQAVNKVENNPSFVPGNHCVDYYCPARSSCGALKEYNNIQAGQRFELVKLKTDLSNIESLSLDQKLKILEAKDLIKNWLDAIFDDVLNYANNGHEVPGWKLVPGRSNRKWKDETIVIDELSKHFNSDQLLDTKLKGIPAIEKLIKANKIVFDLGPLIEKPEGKLTLARDTDTREKQTARAITAFAHIGENKNGDSIV